MKHDQINGNNKKRDGSEDDFNQSYMVRKENDISYDKDCDSSQSEHGHDFEKQKQKQMQDEHDEDEEGISVSELRLIIRTLWKTGLEIFIHQLLYSRGIYPRDSFSSTRFVGAKCEINQNPGVLKYIAEAIKEIIPAIFGHEDCGQNIIYEYRQSVDLLVEIYDQVKGITYERYSMCFSPRITDETDVASSKIPPTFSNLISFYDPKSGTDDSVIEVVEKDLRDLVCSIGKLEGPHVWDDSVSFKIRLKINPSKNCKSIFVFENGLVNTKWVKTLSSKDGTGNCVVYNFSNFACQFQYQIISSQDENEKTHNNRRHRSIEE
mmetsp:Transcript_8789/g.18383  ORF Transcript_8789/g.18383 Transcript_8789/m.18383 type:complete len:321 (-) Transcript_8789:2040-3002(-)